LVIIPKLQPVPVYRKRKTTKATKAFGLGFVHAVKDRKRRSFQSLLISKDVPSLDVLTMALLNSSNQRELVNVLNQNASPFVTFVTSGQWKQSKLLISS
jgi:hypothetical protein